MASERGAEGDAPPTNVGAHWPADQEDVLNASRCGVLMMMFGPGFWGLEELGPGLQRIPSQALGQTSGLARAWLGLKPGFVAKNTVIYTVNTYCITITTMIT
jgi:hypothetical protein